VRRAARLVALGRRLPAVLSGEVMPKGSVEEPWLRAELAHWTKQAETGKLEAKGLVRQGRRHWKDDADLAGLRDRGEPAKLPENEQTAWRALWAEVDELLEKAQGDRP
jgi:hypothetical protein